MKTGPTQEEVLKGIMECLQNHTEAVAIFPHGIANMSYQEQAKWADYVTRNNVNEAWSWNQILSQEGVQHTFAKDNTTSIGNAAYLALYAQNPKVRSICKEYLRQFEEWVAYQPKTENRTVVDECSIQ